MKPAPFDYVRAKSVEEACAALAAPDLTVAALAGGQSLLAMLALRVAAADVLVDISRLDELRAVARTYRAVRLGAATTHAAIEDGDVPDPTGGLMRQVAAGVSYRSVRNHGTIGGSLALADPAADWPGCLLALEALVHIKGLEGERSEPVDDFLRGLYMTSLGTGEIVTGLEIPALGDDDRWGMAKVARKSGAFAESIAFAITGRTRTAVVLTGLDTRARRLVLTEATLAEARC